MAAEIAIAKPFWKSSTLWLNVVGILVIGLQYITDKNLLDPDFQTLALAVLNLINRFRTSTPVKL